MAILMCVNLYTSRIVLKQLGIEDYGIYNVVGGIVAMFSILSGSLSSAIGRFITFELGRDDKKKLQCVFSSSITIQIIIALIIIIIAESIGPWFLNTKMNIPSDRIQAANWVFQFSIATFAINLISVPYNALIIAHEHMSIFAYISMFEGIGKLAVAYLIIISPIDQLIFYAMLLCILAFIVRTIYGAYCKKEFQESRFEVHIDMSLLKQMFTFAGWNFLGNGAYILNTQGVNMLMNIYFGVTVNAARGIAVQVDSALKQFVNSFMTAVNPQITKLYASGDIDHMHNLIFLSAKFSAFLMTYIAVPIILESQTVLSLWLINVPEYATTFVVWSIIASFPDPVLSNALVTSIMATGNIKRYQIAVTIAGGMVFPLSWFAFKIGLDAQISYIIYFAIYSLLLFIRLYIVRSMINLSIRDYTKEVLFRALPIVAISMGVSAIAKISMEAGFLRLCTVFIINAIITSLSIYCIGLTTQEKKITNKKIKNYFTRIPHEL